jgi:hypothetical protein
MTLEELKALYKEKGATTTREEETEQGTKQYTDAVQYGNGWTAFENDNRKIIDYIGQGMDATPVYDEAPKTLGGFSKQEGDYITDYDLNGKAIARRKWNESDLKTMWNYLGPVAMGALTMGGGAGVLGNSLFGLTGTAAAGAGGALAGGFNAAVNDQDILLGALKGGVGSSGALQLGDTGFTLGDITNTAKAIKDKDLLSLLSSSSGLIDKSGIDFGGMSAKDIAKYANIAKGLTSGGTGTISALANLSKDQGFNNLISSFGDGQINPNDFTEGYFLPGGEGYIDPMSKTEGITGPGYYDEITGRYIKDDLGGLQNPLGADTGNLDPNSKWEYSLTRPGVWVNDKGEEIDLSYLPNTEKVMTGAEIMAKAGATAKTTSTNKTSDTKVAATPAETSQSFVGSQQAQLPSQDPYADIKYMEELFGKDTAYKLKKLGMDTKQQTASSNIDALAKLLRG